MAEEPIKKPKLGLVDQPPPVEEQATPGKSEPSDPSITPEDQAALDQDELEYRRLRCDLPGTTGAAAQGIVAIAVSKTPIVNEFFRTHPTFRPTTKLVSTEVGMEKQFFAVDPSMEMPLHGIGINFSEHILYMTISPKGAIHVIPIGSATDNEYTRTKEIGLLDGVKRWVRIYTDRENKVYRVYPAPVERYDEPQWPQLAKPRSFGSASATRAV
jgi:hypothetical protein